VKVRDTLFKTADFHGVLGTWGYHGNGDPEIFPIVAKIE
jgi:hypothetical protein